MTPLGKRVLFAASAAGLALTGLLCVLLAADLYAHHRAERSAGLNRRGYRGPIASRKRPDEIRVAVIGGSTVFGYGVTWDQSFPAQLQQLLNQAGPAPRTFTVVNLGYNSEGAYSFRYTLQDFAYLDADVVCLYEGYNDILGDDHPNLAVYRHDSPVFRLTGYFPILPVILNEKAMALRSGGNLTSAYEQKTVFRPDLTNRVGAAVLDTAGDVANVLARQLERVSHEPRRASVSSGLCPAPWSSYCTAVAVAVDEALAHQRKVLVIGQPRTATAGSVVARSDDQQDALAAMVEQRYAGNPGVRYLDLRSAVDLANRAVAPDGMHLTAEGNQAIAASLVKPILSMAGLRTRR